MITVRVPVFWNADQTRLVPAGHPDAKLQAFPLGAEVTDKHAALFGLTPELASGQPAVQAQETGTEEKPAAVRRTGTTGKVRV